ncbi:MAG: metal ABC transporter permease, partial [Spirochaetia bacterium]|nr:metal ABC transporter permease [Spirochaetia bacterium]
LGSALLTGFIKGNSRIKEDTAMGVVFTGFFAFGIILVSVTPSDVHLMHILFGSLLGIPNHEVVETVVIGILTLTLILIFRKDLMLYIFDPVQARALGLNGRFLNILFLSLLSAAIVVSLQTAGIILVIAMLITPGATAYLLTDRFDRMTLIAVIISNLSALSGTYLSYFLDGATGATIVCIQALIFVTVLFLAPRHGILAQRKARKFHFRS